MDAHPEFQRCRGTPIPLPSALFRRRRLRLLLLRGDPRPLHTLSHHAAGNRCCRYVTSGRRWLGRGPALVGAGVGEDTPGELVSQNSYFCAGAVVWNDVRHFGCGQIVFFSVLTGVWSRDVLPPLPDPLRQRSGPQTRTPLNPLLYRWARERVKFRLGIKLQTYGNTEPDLLKNRLDNIQQLVLSARKKKDFFIPFLFM